MAARAIDPESDAFESAERRLNDWGSACKRNSERLGMPNLSSIAQMIAHVRAEEKKRKGVRRRALQKQRRAWKPGDAPIDPKDAAEAQGFVEPSPTALGKQTQSFRAPSLNLDSDVVQIDVIVSKLPGWMQKPLHRTYRFGQPHRIAARELHMDLVDYRSHWKAAVREVARRLAERGSATVK